MGLDMYLYRQSYVQNWEHQKPEQRHTITIKKGNDVREDIKPERIAYVIEQVGYWRKFNALHNWFIEKCGNGEDNCQKIYISQQDFQDLHDTLTMVKNALDEGDEEKAMELLPPVSGFFFGSDEIDEYYKADVIEALELIENIVNEDCNEDYYYQSSW